MKKKAKPKEIKHGDAIRETAKLRLPCPRLQLTWFELPHEDEFNPYAGKTYTMYVRECVYSIVIPLGHYDIRAEDMEGNHGIYRECFAQISVTTVRGSGGVVDPLDTPFRDGAHANWDSMEMGELPIFIVNGSQFKELAIPDCARKAFEQDKAKNNRGRE